MRNPLSEWWSGLPTWRKVIAVASGSLAILLAVPPVLSFYLTNTYHRPLYDYRELWFYYPYLAVLLVAIAFTAMFFIVRDREKDH